MYCTVLLSLTRVLDIAKQAILFMLQHAMLQWIQVAAGDKLVSNYGLAAMRPVELGCGLNAVWVLLGGTVVP